MADHNFEYANTLQKVSIDTPQGVIECVGGSYAGVPFFVEESSKAGGREIITKVLPFSNVHVNEDGGKKVPGITCNVYLTGVDCEAKRDRLEEALQKEGFFELVHPNYGRLNVRCPSYTFYAKKNEQEYVSGEVTFIPEYDAKNASGGSEDLRGVTIDKSNEVLDSSKSRFAEVFSVAYKAKSVVDSVADSTAKMLDDIENARGSVRGVAAFVNAVSQIRENIQIVMMTPGDFANRIQHLLTLTDETLADDGDNGYVNESLVVMQSRMAKKRSSGSSVADELSAEIDRLTLMSSAAMAVRSVVQSSFVSADEAIEMQDVVTKVFGEASESVDDADDYLALMDLQAAALKYLRDEMTKLAVIVELPLNGTRDVLSSCFDCYGDLERVEDILDRNGIGDPLVMTRGSLRVLSK